MILRLPNSYVEAESDEMEYVDGTVGWKLGSVYSRTQITSDFHTSVYISFISSRTFKIA